MKTRLTSALRLFGAIVAVASCDASSDDLTMHAEEGSGLSEATAPDDGLSETLVAAPANAQAAAALPALLVPRGATWRYLDNGSDQGTAWRATGFVDSSWKSGAAPLGYGNGDEKTVVGYGANPNNRFVTTYFRRSFNVADPRAVTELRLELQRDDGAVVYLNGTEVFRIGMPTGTIGYRTLAVGSIAGADEAAFVTAAVPVAALRAGTNVLAIEIHNNRLDGIDVRLDASLSARLRTETLYWADEFDSPITADRWGVQTLPFSAGNTESQWYRPENVTVSNGAVKITAKAQTYTGSTAQAPAMSFVSSDGINRAAPRTGHPAGSRPFTSGMFSTRDASPKRFFPLFSRFEIRARLPHGQGLLPAFWLRRKDGGASWGEVDIMEYFFNYRPGQTKFSLHFPNTIGVNATQQSRDFEAPVAGTGGFHTWDVVIRPAGEKQNPLEDPIEFTAHLDGQQSGYYKLTDVQTIRDLHMIDRATGAKIDASNPRLSWDVCVNMAVGGKWVGQPDQQLGYLPIVDRCSRTQAAPPGGNGANCSKSDLFFATLPAVFEVDYVRVYDLGY